jgi:hypothetical protein
MTSAEDNNVLDTKLDRIIRRLLNADPDDVIVVNPTERTISEFVGVVSESGDDLPRIKLIAKRSTLRSVMNDFIVASHAADLIDRGALSIRMVEETRENSLLITRESVVALADTGTSVGGLTTDDQEFIDDAFGAYSDMFENADEYSLRTPPISRVRKTLARDIDPSAERDLNEMLDSLETARGDGDGLDEVTISLLVAAKNDILLYDISRWGEDTGIASKATFSRTKTKLEDIGIIDTEKVPIEVGRPRLRLKLADDRLKDADSGQLATVASSIIG